MSAGLRRRLEDSLQTIWHTRGLPSTLLLPLSCLYGVIARRRQAKQKQQAWQAPVPVIVVGNILVGGTGKTPVTEAICQFLRNHGWHPGIISRGYGAQVTTQAHLSDHRTDSSYLGDEPALLHAITKAPVAVHPRRVLAAQALLKAHPEVDVLVADDGLQHHWLARQIEIIVQDTRGTGNGRLLPAGPLREPPGRLQHADWLITQGTADDSQHTQAPGQISVYLQPDIIEHLASGQRQDWAQWCVIHGQQLCSAAAGIGRPQRFFDMLRHAGLALAQTLASPDHQAPSAQALQGLPAGPILITAKDAVKYTPPHDPRLWVVHPKAVFSNPSWLDALEARLREQAHSLPHNVANRH
jgi:tetraacyldisaccharide 4'-kinase